MCQILWKWPDFLIGSGISDEEAFLDAIKNYDSTTQKEYVVISITGGGRNVVDQSEEKARDLTLDLFKDVDRDNIFVSERRDMGDPNQVRIALLIS